MRYITSYFSLVIKCWDQGDLRKEFVLAYGFRGLRVHPWRQACQQEQQAESSPLEPDKRQRANWKYDEVYVVKAYHQ